MLQHSAHEPSPIPVERRPRRTIVLAFLITGVLAMAARSFLQQLEPDDGLPDPSALGSLPAVIDALQNEELSRQHRLIASSAATKFGADAVPELGRLLRSTSVSTRTFALMALRDLGSAAVPAVTELTALVDRATPEELAPLATILARIAPGTEPTIQVLKKCATSDNTVDHTTALRLLPAAGQSQESIVRLLLTNADHIVRIQAMEKLQDQASLAATLVKELEELLHDQRAATSSAAFRTLIRTNNLSDAALGRLLDDPDGPNYSSALYEIRERPGLAETRYDEFLSVLQDAQQPVSVRRAALNCLGSTWPDDWRPCECAADWLLNDETLWTSRDGWFVVSDMQKQYGLRGTASAAHRITSLQHDASAGSVLMLTGTRITAELATDIARIPQLQVLDFSGCAIDEGALKPLEELAALRILSLTVCQITDGHLLKLPSLPALTHVRLWEHRKEVPSGGGFIEQPYERITNDGMSGIARQSALQVLDLANIDITDDGLVHFSDLPNLRYFQCLGPQQYDLTARALSQLKSLRRLELSFVSNADLQFVGRMTELEQLYLQGDSITDAGLPALARLKRLRSLNLNSRNVTQAGVQRLQAALPECRIEAH